MWGEEAGFDGVGGEFAHLFEGEGELLLGEDVLVEEVGAEHGALSESRVVTDT